MTDREQQEWDMKLRKIDAEISNLNAQTAKLTTETKWYLLIVGAAFSAALLSFGKLFF